jgi:hypothetical protein
LTDYWMAFCHPSTTAPATNPASWSEVRLTDTSFNLEQAPSRTFFHFYFFLGDYEGLAAAGNDFVAVWGMPDGSATNQESIFFRRAISRGNSMAPSSVRTDAATPLDQSSQAAAPPAALAPAPSSASGAAGAGPSSATGGNSLAAAPASDPPAGPAGLSSFESLLLGLLDAEVLAAGANLGDALVIDLLLAEQAGAVHA